MKIIQRREMILTRERSVTIKFGNARAENFCAVCNAAAQFITIDEAALIANASRQTIFKLVGTGSLHLNEPSERLPRVCLQSLLTNIKQKNTGEK